MCHKLVFVFVSKVSMLRLWNTRISHLQYGMWAAKTRFGLCGDITSQTHRWRFWLNTHIDFCSSSPAIQWVDDKLLCRKMTSNWWEEFCYHGNLLAGLSNIIPSKWNNLFWLSTVSCWRDKQNLQSWLTELQHFHRAIHFNQPVGRYFPFGFFLGWFTKVEIKLVWNTCYPRKTASKGINNDILVLFVFNLPGTDICCGQ